MWLIKKLRQKELSTGNPPVSDKVAEKIAFVVIEIQRKLSTGMNKIFSNTTTTNLKLMLIAFCLSGGGWSVYLVMNSAKKESKNEEVFNINYPIVSKHLIPENHRPNLSNNQINDATINSIMKFKSYMDSLKNKRSYLYDSIIRARPFLMDSVRELEKIYLSQNKK